MPVEIRKKLRAVMDLIRIDRQYGTLLLLMPTLWSLFVASNGSPTPEILLIFIAGSFLMRSAGCAVNDIADRHFDGRVERTRQRPLPSGRLTVPEAWAVFLLLVIASLYLVLQLNTLTRWLGLGGIALAAIYPLTKRVTHLPQMVMGIAFGWGSVMAWTAVRGAVEPPVLRIFLANLFWATAYDTIYALMDREDDRRIGVKSAAILFGRHTWIAVGVLFGLSILFFLLLGAETSMGPVYYIFIAGAAVALARQAAAIRHERNHPAAFALFKSNVGVGLMVLAGLVLNYHL